MKDDDLRKQLRDWDPVEKIDGPDSGLLARIRRRRDGAAAPEWVAGRRRVLWRGWTWSVGLTGAVAAIVLLAVILRPEPAAPEENPQVTAKISQPEAASALRDKQVQIVLTTSNGVRVYWNYEPGSSPGI